MRWESEYRGRQANSAILLRLLSLAMVAVLLHLGQVHAQEDTAKSGPLREAVYRRPLGADPETLDPARIRDIYSRSVAQQIFDGLVQFDQTLAVMPALAQFWTSSRDGLNWTFHLRKGVKFHHGKELDAEDVVFSITRLLDPKTGSSAADLFLGIRGARAFRAGRAKAIEGLSAVDRYTVRAILDETHAPLVSLLAMGHAKVVPKDIVGRAPDEFGLHPIGTGPFRFVSWERGKQIVLASNPDYFDGRPRLSRVVYKIFTGEQVEEMYAEFRRGNLEDTPVPMLNYRRVLARADHVYVKRPMLNVRFFGLNTRWGPFRDRRVRRALLFALDREGIVESAFLGRYVPARGVLPPGTMGYNPNLRGIAHDAEKARQLLAGAGYPGGRGLPVVPVWSGIRQEAFVRMYELVRRSWAEVGIRTEMRYESDWPTYSGMLAEGRLPVFLYTWYADVPDPDNFLSKLFHSRSPQNLFGYANPIVDGLLEEARRTPDMQRRVELYRRAEQIILDDAPLIPILHHTYERLFQPYVRSVEVNGLGDPYIPLRKIWLDRKD